MATPGGDVWKSVLIEGPFDRRSGREPGRSGQARRAGVRAGEVVASRLSGRPTPTCLAVPMSHACTAPSLASPRRPLAVPGGSYPRQVEQRIDGDRGEQKGQVDDGPLEQGSSNRWRGR